MMRITAVRSSGMRTFAGAAALTAFAVVVGAQTGHAPQERTYTAIRVPDGIKAPAGEKVVFRAHATGAQIYVCQQGADGKPQWTLKAPEAELRDGEGALVGRHYAGPTWKHNDGSEVTGKAAAKADSPDGAIPWLLVNATGHSGSGVLAQVTTIQRINTKGGQPPATAECDATKLNTEARSAYSADYYFYAPAK